MTERAALSEDRRIILALFAPETGHKDGCLFKGDRNMPCCCGFAEVVGNGDYPGLDLERQRWNNLLRQAGAALCVVGVLFYSDHQEAGAARIPQGVAATWQHPLPNKSVAPNFIEMIQIGNIAVNPKTALERKMKWKVVLADLLGVRNENVRNRREFLSFSDGLSGLDMDIARSVYWDAGQRANLVIDAKIFDYGRSSSGIFEGYRDVWPRIFISNIVANATEGKLAYMDSWPVGRNSGFGGFASGDSYADCKYAQNDCENRDDEGRKRGYLVVKYDDELAGVMQPDYQRSVWGGAIVMFGIIGLLYFAILFWWLITRP